MEFTYVLFCFFFRKFIRKLNDFPLTEQDKSHNVVFMVFISPNICCIYITSVNFSTRQVLAPWPSKPQTPPESPSIYHGRATQEGPTGLRSTEDPGESILVTVRAPEWVS